jgi:hypothetical protein
MCTVLFLVSVEKVLSVRHGEQSNPVAVSWALRDSASGDGTR